jgi:uncharacterized protein
VKNPLRIVIPGGSGLLGTILARHFHEEGHAVAVLSRQVQSRPWRVVGWNGRDLGEWAKQIDGADVVINLAGRNVNCRYTAANCREIMESRVLSTEVLGRAIGQAARPPRLWMNSSTATIYRDSLDHAMDEASGELGGNEPGVPAAWRFSIVVATHWERAFSETCTPATRKILLRSAVVMSADHNGAFSILSNLVRFGLGGKAGSGRQFVSWIHETDFVRAVDFLIAQDSLHGCFNLCSPNPLPNHEFMQSLRRAYGVAVGLPAAEWMLEIGAFFLRTETELVLKSRRVIPRRLLQAGFEFLFPEWDAAALDLARRWRQDSRPICSSRVQTQI